MYSASNRHKAIQEIQSAELDSGKGDESKRMSSLRPKLYPKNVYRGFMLLLKKLEKLESKTQ